MQSIRLICLVLFAILTVTTAKHLYEPRIVRGQDAKEGQFPYTVSLRNRESNDHFCGASILSSRFLLTAAHCCLGLESPKDIIAVVGVLRQSRGGLAVDLDTLTPHDGFDLNFGRYDVAVLRTATEIIFNNLVQPIALPTTDTPDDRAVQVVIAGWGRHKFPSDERPDVLQFSEFKTISLGECAKRFANYKSLLKLLHKNNLCVVSDKKSGACHGDSGGGLIDMTDPNNRTVVGITSWVNPCALGYPDVYTRVYSHVDWIKQQIEKQSGDL